MRVCVCVGGCWAVFGISAERSSYVEGDRVALGCFVCLFARLLICARVEVHMCT